MSEPASAPSLLALTSFPTWAPLLRAWTQGMEAKGADGVLHLAGAMGPDGTRASGGVPARARDSAAAREAAALVREALTAAAAGSVTFSARIEPSGRTRLRMTGPSTAVEQERSDGTTLLLAEGAVPEPWRRPPGRFAGARPARPGDAAALERWLLERIPGPVGVEEAEFAAVEERLGLRLPDDLKALYRVVGARPEDWDTPVYNHLRIELFPLADLRAADAASRPAPWRYAACEAVASRPDAAVQGLVGSPGWIAFGDNGCGDVLALDLTPGPAGRTGQVVAISHEAFIRAELAADSLLDLVRDIEPPDEPAGEGGRHPAVAHVGPGGPHGVDAVACPELEVLCVAAPAGSRPPVDPVDPVDLAPLAGLPRLRTLTADPGTLADPRQVGRLGGLEYLELGPAEWRTLLDAGAVPRGLAAAAVTTRGLRDHEPLVGLCNEILALWGRPPVVRAVIDGDLGPLPHHRP
ncbi:SMI1/KNR4 family protein [Streptomyces abyssomicinicus]|uniref:SMI1/KNR4 family protein n=1 Tax=Streptomyces abyssomicinicus TaxID=574929 RepID=UPI00124F911B|nr:SMI1/KNR4 family protein [Streptomyces abyssomicinicus]